MEIKGKIILKLDLQSGTSKAGKEWKKQEYVLETLGQYPRKVKFDFFGERADQYTLEVGDVITLSYDIESREFNGRWYTDIRGFNAVKDGAQAPQPVAQQQQTQEPLPQGDTQSFMPGPEESNDDLPF